MTSIIRFYWECQRAADSSGGWQFGLVEGSTCPFYQNPACFTAYFQPSNIGLRAYLTEFVVSSIVLGELQYGILLLPAGRKRTRLLKWFAEGVRKFPVLDFDSATADTWARLLARLKKKGKAMPVKDSMIAAIAKKHGFIIATRNVVDFQHAGVKLVNPFDGES